MPTATYNYYVDWNNDGNFGDSYENISAYVLYTPNLFTGRYSDVDHDEPGKAQIYLDNSSAIFSSNNDSSPIYGSILPNRRVKVTMTYGGTTKTIWSGFLDNINLLPCETVDTATAVLNASGALSQFGEAETNIALQSIIQTSAAITLILEADGWPAGDREIGTGLTTEFRWWPERWLSRIALMRDLQDMELGRLREGRDFKITFDPRDHIFNAPHDSAQATYGIGTLYYWNIRQLDSQPEIYNDFSALVRAYYITNELDLITICDINDDKGGVPPIVPASGSLTLYVDLPDNAGYQAVQTWGTTSYDANTAGDGSGSDITSDVSVELTGYATRAKLVFSNANASDAHLIKLIQPVMALLYGDIAEVPASDETSQGKYGIRRYPYAGTRYASTAEAKEHGDHIIALFKDPRIRLQFDVRANYDANHLAEVRDREVGDRIHVTAGEISGLYIDDDFIIDSIRHDLSDKYDHRMTIVCTKAPSAELGATAPSYSPYTKDSTISSPDLPSDIFYKTIDSLDDVEDGQSFGRVQSPDVYNGRIRVLKTDDSGARVEIGTSPGIIVYDADESPGGSWNLTDAIARFKKIYSYDYSSSIDLSDGENVYIDTKRGSGGALRIQNNSGHLILRPVAADHGEDPVNLTLSSAINSNIEIYAGSGFASKITINGTDPSITISGNLKLTGDVALPYIKNVKDPNYGAVGDGITDDTTAILNADTDAGSSGFIYIPEGTYKLNDLTLTSNVICRGILKPQSGKTVKPGKTFSAGLYQVFDESAGGSIDLSDTCVKEVYPEQWGAGGLSVDSTTAVQAAIDSMKPVLLSQIYKLTAEVGKTNTATDDYSGITIIGKGYFTGFYQTHATDNALAFRSHLASFNDIQALTLENFSIFGSGTGTGLYLLNVIRSKINLPEICTGGKGVHSQGGYLNTINVLVSKNLIATAPITGVSPGTPTNGIYAEATGIYYFVANHIVAVVEATSSDGIHMDGNGNRLFATLENCGGKGAWIKGTSNKIDIPFAELNTDTDVYLTSANDNHFGIIRIISGSLALINSNINTFGTVEIDSASLDAASGNNLFLNAYYVTAWTDSGFDNQYINLINEAGRDRRISSVSATRATTDQVVATGTWTNIVYNSESRDSLSEFELSNGTFVAANNGIYYVAAQATIDDLGDGVQAQIQIVANGVEIATTTIQNGAAGDATVRVACAVEIDKGQSMVIQIKHEHGANRSVLIGTGTVLTINRLFAGL